MFYKVRHADAAHGGRGAAVALADPVASAYDAHAINSTAPDVAPR